MPGQIYPNYESPTTQIQGTPVASSAPSDGEILIYSGPANAYIPGDPIVSGPDPVGTPPTVNPVQVAGVGPDGNVHEVQTDLLGDVKVDASSLIDILTQLVLELRALRHAVVALDRTLDIQDFEPSQFAQGPSAI